MSVGFRGASANQDSRFSNKDKKLLKTLSFPEELNLSVDFKKVNLDVIKPWIVKRVTEAVNFEDDVLIGMVLNLLEEENVNPKMMQIQLTPFLESNAGQFMLDLWKLLLSAMENPSGIPQAFLDAKAEEAKQKRLREEEMDRRYESLRSESRRDDRGMRRPRSPRRRSRSYSPRRGRSPRRESYSPQRSVRRDHSPRGYRRSYHREHDRNSDRNYRRRSPSYERYHVSQKGSRGGRY